jgi:hypothetical protein
MYTLTYNKTLTAAKITILPNNTILFNWPPQQWPSYIISNSNHSKQWPVPAMTFLNKNFPSPPNFTMCGCQGRRQSPAMTSRLIFKKWAAVSACLSHRSARSGVALRSSLFSDFRYYCLIFPFITPESGLWVRPWRTDRTGEAKFDRKYLDDQRNGDQLKYMVVEFFFFLGQRTVKFVRWRRKVYV